MDTGWLLEKLQIFTNFLASNTSKTFRKTYVFQENISCSDLSFKYHTSPSIQNVNIKRIWKV
jgi:hypothetical protein